MYKAEGAPTYSAEDYLYRLNSFLGETAQIARTQQQWMQWGRGLIKAAHLESCDRALSYQIRSNIEAASTFVQDLGSRGLRVMVNVDEQLRPLEGIGFNPEQGVYDFGVTLPGGRQRLPQSETVQLNIQPITYY